MRKTVTKTLLLGTLLAAAAVGAGCTQEPDLAKQNMEQAFLKQSEATAYSFAGKASMNIQLPSEGTGKNLIASALKGMLTKGNLEWSGAASYEPVRLEAELKSTPEGSTAPLSLPLLFKDNKLYLQLPLLGKQNESFSLDMAELSGLSGQANPFTQDSLKAAGKLVSEAFRLLIADIDAKWFATVEETELADGSKAPVYRLEITEKNKSELETAIKGRLPELIDRLSAAGIASDAQVQALKSAAAGFVLHAPGEISVAVDQTGYVRRESLQLAFSGAGAGGASAQNSIKLEQSFADINGAPAFKQEPPANARSLGDILKLLMPQTGKK
ncbi:hypothetical protein [Paenibacillus sp. YN15]|uniref:hypothetical protein n=1 Tax=Paenibacillus sp. YN15 TaxID=1742774 RepID=UPI000DCD4164|nr:hypothetical protein [Paenibacillus sp. YN15]RAU99186.1 hypothetical protein DQG13_16165 [Paenibacillus sp. YN15]